MLRRFSPDICQLDNKFQVVRLKLRVGGSGVESVASGVPSDSCLPPKPENQIVRASGTGGNFGVLRLRTQWDYVRYRLCLRNQKHGS
jgi:hypothetical protein